MYSIKFSIITISFNSVSTIERTLKSVLSQNYGNYEYIIIDGASKDGTLSIIKEYEPKFNGHLKLISEPDEGIYNAMNKGIKIATGDIIGIVNSDDWLEREALQIIQDCFIKNGESLDSVYCGWINFQYANGESQIMKTSHEKLIASSKNFIMSGIRHPAVFVPRKIYCKYDLFDESLKIMADQDLILRLLFAGVQFIYPNKVISNMSDGGVSNRYDKRTYNDYLIILRKNEVSKERFIWLSVLWKCRLFVKALMPMKVIFLYRGK